jgi:DNA-binding NarL/FixJ family response regulator
VDVVEDQAFTRMLTVERLQALTGPGGRVRGFGTVEQLIGAGDYGNVVVLDLQLEGGGLEGGPAIERMVDLGVVVLVLSGLHSAEALQRAQAAGAAGYVGKDTASMDDLMLAIGAVLRGHHHVDPNLLAGIGATARRRLTGRQQEVLRLEALGRTTGQVARELGLTEAGVRRHVENIAEIYPDSRKQADRVRLALALGLLSPWELYDGPANP